MTKKEAKRWLPIIEWLDGVVPKLCCHSNTNYYVSIDNGRSHYHWVGGSSKLWRGWPKYQHVPGTLDDWQLLYSLATGRTI